MADFQAPNATEREPALGSGRGWILAAVAIVALGFFLRFETFHRRALWWDEQVTYRIATGVQTPQEDIENPVLHPLIVALFVRSLDAVSAVRLPSVVFGVVSLVLLVRVGRELHGLPVGVLSAFMMATSAYPIYYSQDGRAYALLLALVLGQYLLLFSFVRRRRPAPLVGFALLGAMSLYAHHVGAIVQVQILVTVLAWFAVELRKTERSQVLTRVRSLVPLAVAFAAIALVYLPQTLRTLRWAGRMQDPSDRFRLVPSPRFFHELFARWGSGPDWTLYVYEACFLLGLALVLRDRRRATVLVPWLCAPFVAFAVVPFSHFFDIRYVMSSLPAFYLVVALGMVSLGEAVRSWLRRREVRDTVAARWALVASISPALIFGIANGVHYLTFRKIPVRCSQFFSRPEILDLHDGFCRDHVMLNSLIDGDEYMLSRVE